MARPALIRLGLEDSTVRASIRDLAFTCRVPLTVLLLLGQFVVRGELSLREESAFWDEPLHMYYGLGFLSAHRWPPEDHPYPITAALVLPLRLTQPRPEQRLPAPPAVASQHDVRDWNHPDNLRPPRRVNLVLGGLALLLLAALVRRRLGGQAALYVLCLGSLDPGWIASARYLTTDLALGAALALGALVLGDRELRPRWLALGCASLALAVGLWSKLSGVLLVPAALLIVFAREPGSLGRRSARALLETAVVAVAGGALYLAPFIIQSVAASGGIVGGLVDLWSGARAALAMQSRARGVFLAGHFYEGGSYLYHPLLLLTKTPLALLALVILPACFAKSREILRRQWVVFLFPALFLAAAVLSRINLGHRHLTPLLPFLWLLGAIGLGALRERLGSLAAGALLGTLLLEVCLAHPHYLPFTNALGGGIEGAHRVAVDGDSGQALPSLARYLRDQPPRGGPVHLAYFGKGDPARYGLGAVWRPCGKLGRWPWRGPRAGCREEFEVLAVSATCLQGETTGRAERDDCYAWLRGRPPSEVIAGSILVFRKDEPR